MRYGCLGHRALLWSPSCGGTWHLLQILWVGGTYSGGLPVPLSNPVFLLWCSATDSLQGVLIVWVYDRTGSLLVGDVMHMRSHK